MRYYSDKVASFVEQLSLKKIPGIGPKTFQKLTIAMVIATCADVRESHLPATTINRYRRQVCDQSVSKSHTVIDNQRLRRQQAAKVARDRNYTNAQDVSSAT